MLALPQLQHPGAKGGAAQQTCCDLRLVEGDEKVVLLLVPRFSNLVIYWPGPQGLVSLLWCMPFGACHLVHANEELWGRALGSPHAAAPGVSCSARLMPCLSRSGCLGGLNVYQLLSILAVQGARHRVTPAFNARPVCPADAVHCIKAASRPAAPWAPDYSF